jgi:hypothetical protein
MSKSSILGGYGYGYGYAFWFWFWLGSGTGLALRYKTKTKKKSKQGQDHVVWVCTLARYHYLNHQRDLPPYQEGPFFFVNKEGKFKFKNILKFKSPPS